MCGLLNAEVVNRFAPLFGLVARVETIADHHAAAQDLLEGVGDGPAIQDGGKVRNPRVGPKRGSFVGVHPRSAVRTRRRVIEWSKPGATSR
jgi:hypothetical protein